MMVKMPGDLYAGWAARHSDDVGRLKEVTARFGWSANWAKDLVAAMAVICLSADETLDELNDRDFDGFVAALDDWPSAGRDARNHNSARAYSLHQVCYELGICHSTPRTNRRPAATLAEHLEAIPQPEIRRIAHRYLQVVATTLRPSSVLLRTDSLVILGEYLAAHHRDVSRLEQLERHHLEGFLAWNHGRPWRDGWRETSRFRPTCPSTPWSTCERSSRTWPSRVGRSAQPASSYSPPTSPASIVHCHELCRLTPTGSSWPRSPTLWDTPTHGTWVKVPVGKLGTERTVPPRRRHPRRFRRVDVAPRSSTTAHASPRRPPRRILFMERGRRLSAYRLRHGLDDAVTDTGLVGRGGQPLRVTPRTLRHTYATSLVNAGMSLQALMAVFGHVSAEMTLRYASIASPTVRAAYQAAMGKIRARSALVVAPAGKTAVPDPIEWLRAEMLKTRVAHGYCARELVTEACPYANICEQCENYVTAPEFGPALQSQLDDIHTIRDDAQARGWDSEVARQERVIASLERHLQRLTNFG